MTRRKWIALASALAMMVLGAGLLLWLKNEQRLGRPGVRVAHNSTGHPFVELPNYVGLYDSTNVGPMKIEVQTLPADTTFGRRMYFGPNGFELLLTVVLMGSDRTSIHKPEFCLQAQGWQIVKEKRLSLPIGGSRGYRLPIEEYVMHQRARDEAGQQVERSGVFLFWFLTDRRLTASHWERMWAITWDLMRYGVLPRWAYVSCFAACRPGDEQATYRRMAKFLKQAVPQFQLTRLSKSSSTAGRLGSR